MPRRALSTLRAEIRDGGVLGASMELSEFSSVPVVSAADISLELLMENPRVFEQKLIEFENLTEPFFGAGDERFCREMYAVAVVVVVETAILLCQLVTVFLLFGFFKGGEEIRQKSFYTTSLEFD